MDLDDFDDLDHTDDDSDEDENQEDEHTLQDTALAALTQINEKEYDTELVDEWIDKDHIVHYGFAFEGKKVLIFAG